MERSLGSSTNGTGPFEMPLHNGSVSNEEGLAILPPPFRLTLLLAALEGMSYEDVAATVEVSTNEMRSRVGGIERLPEKAQRLA